MKKTKPYSILGTNLVKSLFLIFGFVLLVFSSCNLRNVALSPFGISTSKPLNAGKTLTNGFHCSYHQRLSYAFAFHKKQLELTPIPEFFSKPNLIPVEVIPLNGLSTYRVRSFTDIPLYILHRKIKAFIV